MSSVFFKTLGSKSAATVSGAVMCAGCTPDVNGCGVLEAGEQQLRGSVPPCDHILCHEDALRTARNTKVHLQRGLMWTSLDKRPSCALHGGTGARNQSVYCKM
jgi:hypothetical protein